MAIDASIYSQIQQPQIQDPLNAFAKFSQVKTLQNQNRLADLAYSAKQQDLQGQNALSDAYRGAVDPITGAIDRNKLFTLLAQGGQGSKLPAIQKNFSDLDKSVLETEKGKLQGAIQKQGIIAQYAGAAKDQASWTQGLQELQKMGVDVSQIPQQFDPQTAATLRDRALTGVQQLDQHWKSLDFNYKQKQLGETQRHNKSTEGIASAQLSQGKTPSGYRQTQDGNLQAIPGGPADLKLQGAFNQDTGALNSSMGAMDRLAIAANEAMNHPGLAGTAGLRGMIPNVPGTDAADAAALLNTLKSQVAFGVLQDMRNNSKTGGALGSVSDAEGKRLEANLAALEKSQSVDQLKKNLQKIVDYTQQAKDRLRGAYNMKHSNISKSAPPASAKPADDIRAQADAILKGQ